MAELTRMQSVKQGTRNFLHKASDKMKIAGAKTTGGDTKELDVAIVKATTCNFHVVPKEKHVRTLKMAVHSSRQRKDVAYVIMELYKRLQSSSDWLTALKTLITIHRLMRETDVSFLEELVKASTHLTHGKGRLLNMDNFIDLTNIEGRFDFSEWVRAYGKYLDEQLDCYTAIHWYVEQEQPGSQSRLRSLVARDLLFQLPHLQRLQRRLLDCAPKGQAARDPVVLFSLGVVVKESFTLYKAVSEGIINLADSFFEMEYLDAAKALEQYKESIASNDALATFYATIEQIEEVKRAMQLPKLSAPPTDFIKSMEAYLHDAPRPADAEAPKKAAPLRKGRMMQSTKRPAAAGITADASAAARDPGMVLPVGLPPSSAPASQPTSPAAPASAPSSARAAPAAPAAPAGHMDLLGFGDLTLTEQPSAAGTAAAGDSKPTSPNGTAAPAGPLSALDLLSGLDFSYSAPAAAAPAAPAPVPAPVPAPSSNPFGAPQPLAQPQPYYSAAAPYSTYSMSGSMSGGYAPSPQQHMQRPQQQHYPMPSPGGSLAPQPYDMGSMGGGMGMGMLGSPTTNSNLGSPAGAGGVDSLRSSGSNQLRTSGSGLTGGTPARSPGANVDLFKAAGAHDPFAALTSGMPVGGSWGAAPAGTPNPRSSPGRPAQPSPNTSVGNLFM